MGVYIEILFVDNINFATTGYANVPIKNTFGTLRIVWKYAFCSEPTTHVEVLMKVYRFYNQQRVLLHELL